MGNLDLYRPLLDLAIAKIQLQQELNTNPGHFRKSKLKKAIDGANQKLDEQCRQLVTSTLETWNSPNQLSQFLRQDIDQIVVDSDASWHEALHDVQDRIVRSAEKEEQKSGTRRKIEKNGWWLTIAGAAATMLFLKWYWLVPVDDPIESIEGLRQRGEALNKVIGYDDLIGSEVRRGGWLKGILFWPTKPTDSELEYAAEFLWSTVGVYSVLRDQGELCSASLNFNAEDDFLEDELAIAEIALAYLQTAGATSHSDSEDLVVTVYQEQYPCNR